MFANKSLKRLVDYIALLKSQQAAHRWVRSLNDPLDIGHDDAVGQCVYDAF